MTPWGWGLVLVLLLVLVIVGWQYRRTRQDLLNATADARMAQEQAKLVEAERDRLSDFLKVVGAVSSDAIMLIDADHTVLWLNDAARALCVEAIEIPLPLNKALRSYEILDLVDKAMEDRQPHDRQFAREEATYHATATQVQSQPLLVALVVEDVTELQRLGRARRDFVANISHDLRTPIAAIQVMVETLQSPAASSEKRRKKLLKGIIDQTAALEQLSQELLDLSLIESGRMPLRLVETPIEDLIEPVVERMKTQAESKDITIHTEYDPELQVLADPDSIRRVLQNLLHNALKFSDEGGNIVLGVEAESEDVIVRVSDTGVGIKEEDLDRIFERFYKADRMRSERGTGLGLAIARHIIEGHGGRIWVESQPEQGATFYFTLLRA